MIVAEPVMNEIFKLLEQSIDEWSTSMDYLARGEDEDFTS